MNQERWFGISLLIISALLWFWIIPEQTAGPKEAFAPRLIVLFIALPGLFMLLRNRPSDNTDLSGLRIFLAITLPTIALFLMFLLAVSYFGFFSSGFVFAICALLLYGERRWTYLLFLPLGLFGLIWLVIVAWLKFPLPEGVFF